MRTVAICALVVAVVAGCPAATPQTSIAAKSANTTVNVALAPFSIAFGSASTTSSAAPVDDGCAPISIALRSNADSGEWHKPEQPKGDEIFLHPGTAHFVDASHAHVDMIDAKGAVKAHATIALSAAKDGWVDVDAKFDVDELNVAYVGTCFALASDEHLVGGGERFDGPDLRGHVVPAYFDAPGEYDSGTNESHAPVPFIASNKGYAVLVDEERVGAFDVGVAHSNATTLRFHGNELHLAVRTGAIVDDVAAFARRVGLPPAPPAWALAPMQWRNSVDVITDANGVVKTGTDQLLDDANEMRARHIPASTIWIDAPWETGYNTFVVNEAQLPAFDDAMQTLESEGFHVVTWATDAVNNSDDHGQAFGMPAFASKSMFDAFDANGFLVKNADGSAFTFPWGRGVGGFVDFTNGDACNAFKNAMTPLLNRGVRGFKLDYGETMRPDVLGLEPNDLPHFSDGSTTSTMHTKFARLYHECYLDALSAKWPADNFVITRTGALYDQKNGVAIWPGDLDASFAKHGDPVDGDATKLAVGGLPSAIGGFLSLAMSAYPLYGSDVGGYRGAAPSTELFVRWAQFASLSTIMQTGGGANYAAWDAEYVDVIGAYSTASRAHMDLWPMWQEWTKRASTDGTPIAVPIGVVDDRPDAWNDAFTFVVGDALLVAPVIEEGATKRTLFVPTGSWTSWWDDNVVVTGPAVVTVDAPIEQMPLFLRDDAIVVLADPTLDTALPCSTCTGRTDTRVVRSAIGTGGAHVVAGDVDATRTINGKSVALTATNTGGLLVLDLHLGAKTGTNVTLKGEQPLTVSTDAALLSCSTACVLVEDHRVRAASVAHSAELDVDVQ